MTALSRRLERQIALARAVPLPQAWRRAQLIVRRKIEPFWPVRPPAGPIDLAETLPPPLFAPRAGQLAFDAAGRPELVVHWGRYPLAPPVDWSPRLASRLDGSWRARLHYMEYLEAADDRLFEALIEDWLGGNRPHDGDAARYSWRPFNLSIRVVVWLQQLALRRARLKPSLVDRMAASLAHQLAYLERYLETDLRGNHLIKNIKALIWAGAAFNGSAAERWRRRGEALLSGELDEQVLADGMHYERSPAYHCQVFADLMECRQVLSSGAPVKGRLDACLARMAAALRHLAHPDGLVAAFNDGGLFMAYPPAVCLAAYGGVGAPAEGPFALPDAGYFGCRRGGDYLIVDCGPLAPDYLIGHGHGDILSFEWSLQGRRIIVDQGTFQNLSGPERTQSRATVSHNTLALAGDNQGDFYGAHRCGRRPQPVVHRWAPSPDGFILEGSHNGYRHLPASPIHRRRFTAAAHRLTVDDRIDGAHPGAVGGFLLHPDCKVDSDGRQALIRNGPVHIRLSASLPLRIVPALWFPDLYCAEDTRRIVFELDPMTTRAQFVFEQPAGTQ